ncbi:MAG: endonuclease [Acidobacteriota bacterium]|nr:endonuclease [Acidobacteriota bacterium]
MFAFVFVFLLSPATLFAQIPAGYYDSATGLTGNALADALHEIIDDHLRFPYTASTTDTWDIVEAKDEDPNNSNNIISIYKNESKAKSDHAQGSGWNREHSWPKSLGFPDDGSCNYPYTDTHHLFAADWSYNSARSNKPYNDCNSGCTEWDALGSTSSNWTAGSFTSGSWETWDTRKGDVARAMFYMAVRYNGGTHGITGCTEIDLRLTNNVNEIISYSTNQSVGYMGYLDVLVAWHNADPVDADEQYRNDVVYSYQGNRNPFIDHPEWVAAIFGGGDGSGGTNNGGGGNPGGGTGGSGGTGGTGTIWINEIHYDNASTDTGEGIEIAGPAGTDTTGWQLVLYNGNGGASYSTTNLSGTLSDQSNGFGTAWYAVAGIQNGAPDGVALVDPQGTVTEFISYEGTFTATDGPANGQTSTDIGVAETSSTPAGHSLQLGGTGSTGADFSWQAEQADTPGSPNTGQTFTSGGSGGTGGTGGSGTIWVNEIHYDNTGTDTGEGIEIAGPAGTDTSGWQLVLYNGNGGASYNTTNLSGTLTDQGSGLGTAWYAITGVQNGSPDGIALVDPQGTVTEFISYEGTFTAVGGPADGLTSTDIGVAEGSSTAIGDSLQLAGSGSSGSDFTWQSEQANTAGAPNTGQTYTGGTGGGTGTGALWINEIHYDNDGADTGEGVEIAGPAGADTTGWQLVAYNGNGGSSYDTTNLSGTLSDQSNGFGFVWYNIAGLQNGAPDGIALVDDTGAVIEFLSWEGTFTAVGGPADGLTSTDIGVSEASSTPVGHSLQLGGTGSGAADFTWQAAQTDTPGAVNAGQTMSGSGGSGSSWTVLETTDFESGSMSPYSDGGSDARISSNDSAYAHGGTYCVRLRDNSGTASSIYHTNGQDYSAYSEIKIELWFYARSMESGEDFFVEFWDGSQWNVVGNYVVNTDFNNGEFSNKEIIVNSGIGAANKIRFRCDASANNDYIYLDDVVISGK